MTVYEQLALCRRMVEEAKADLPPTAQRSIALVLTKLDEAELWLQRAEREWMAAK